MTQEEKAKRYDEAYKVAKNIHIFSSDLAEIKRMEEIFPELKEESEDERIRKKICKLLWDNVPYEEAQEYIAWLEKQCEQKPVIEMKTPEESLGIDSETYSKIVDECIYGEQKPADKSEPKDYSSIDPHFFKTTDKVEPKFKVGDLVKDTNHNKQPIYKVNYIDKECYICTSDDATLGDKAVMHFAFDNPYLRLVEQKPAWSKEDETKIKSIIALLKSPALCTMDGNKGIIDESIKYLKSLKYRVQLFPR